MKLIHPFSGVAAIFFPVGKLKNGGTCEFATAKCLKECVAFKNATKQNKIDYKDKYNAFTRIIENDIFDLTYQLAKQVRESHTNILYWFASGDCPSKHTTRIVDVIGRCSSVIPVQMGFTRNEELWETANRIGNVRLILTLERLNKSKIQSMSTSGVIAVPDYEKGDIQLYRNKESIGGCGANIAYYERLGKRFKHKANCNICFREKTGCFQDFEIKGGDFHET